MSRSEIADAKAIVAGVTLLLDGVPDDDDEPELLLPLYADAEALRLVLPEAGPDEHALQLRICRTAARAAWRFGYDVAVLRVRAAPLAGWLARQAPAARRADDYPGEPGDRLSGEAALRALGLSAAELKAAPRKPPQGRTLAARIARWATDPEAEEELIAELAEELIAQRLDGALAVVERMLEPEDVAYARHEIDLVASSCLVGEPGRERLAVLFASPVMRAETPPGTPALPEGLGERLAAVAPDPTYAGLILAPYWVATAALARLTPSALREVAEALANGIEPPVPPAAPADRDLCVLGLTLPEPSRPEDEAEEAEAAARLEAWIAAIAEAAGGGRAEAPLSLARALDLLRRVRLAVPDEPGADEEAWDDAEEDDAEVEVSEALLDALLAMLGGTGTGHALLTNDGAAAIRIAEGVPDIEAETLRAMLAEALSVSGVLFVVPDGAPGAPARGFAFLLEAGEAEGLSAADAAAAFAEEAPADWVAAPARWVDAPPLDYDPGAG